MSAWRLVRSAALGVLALAAGGCSSGDGPPSAAPTPTAAATPTPTPTTTATPTPTPTATPTGPPGVTDAGCTFPVPADELSFVRVVDTSCEAGWRLIRSRNDIDHYETAELQRYGGGWAHVRSYTTGCVGGPVATRRQLADEGVPEALGERWGKDSVPSDEDPAQCPAFVVDPPGTVRRSFYGYWYVHGAQVYLHEDGTGSDLSAYGFGEGAATVYPVTEFRLTLSADGATLTGEVTGVHWVDEHGVRRHPHVPPDQAPEAEVDDRWVLRFVRPHLLRSVGLDGAPPEGNPYLCDRRTTEPDSRMCGA